MKLVFFSLVLFYLSITILKCQELILVKESSDSFKYSLDNVNCRKNFWILVEDSVNQGGLEFSNFECDFSDETYGFLENTSTIHSSDGYTYFKVSIQLPVVVEESGSLIGNCKLTVNNSIQISISNLEYQCIQLPSELSNISLFNGELYYNGGFHSRYTTIVRFNDIVYPTHSNVICSTLEYFSSCQIRSITFNTYLIELNNIVVSTVWDQPPIQIEIHFLNTTNTVILQHTLQISKTSSFPTISKINNSNQIQILNTIPTPPNDQSNYNRIYNLFKINNDKNYWFDINPSYCIFNNNNNYLPKLYWPAYSSNTNSNSDDDDDSEINYLIVGYLNENLLNSNLLYVDQSNTIDSVSSIINNNYYLKASPESLPNPLIVNQHPLNQNFYSISIEHSYYYGFLPSLIFSNQIIGLDFIVQFRTGSFPFIKGSKLTSYQISYPLTIDIDTNDITISYSNIKEYQLNLGSSSNSGPILNYAIIKPLNSSHFYITVSAKVTDGGSSIQRIEICSDSKGGQLSNQPITQSNLVYGTLSDGIWEKLFDQRATCLNHSTISISLIDFTLNVKNYNDESEQFLYNQQLISLPKLPSLYINSNDNNILNHIVNFKFKYPTLDLKSSINRNELSFQFNGNENIDQKELLVPILLPIFDINTGSLDIFKDGFYGNWDDDKDMYIIDFYLPNRLYDKVVIDYQLYLSPYLYESSTLYHFLGNNSELKVNTNNYYKNQLDQYPPIISTINRYPIEINNINDTNNSKKEYGYDIYIDDGYNWFKKGLVVISSNADFRNFTYEFTTKDCKWNSSVSQWYYPLRFIIEPENCQIDYYEYTIVSAILTDRNEWTSDSNDIFKVNPFVYYLDIRSDSNLIIYCDSDSIIPDSEPPELLSLTIADPISKQIDVFSISRSLHIIIKVQDLVTGLSPNYKPIITLNSVGFENLYCSTTLDNYTSINNIISSAFYSCLITLPIGFGYNDQSMDIQLSVLNLVDNKLNFNSYSSIDLSNQGFDYSISISETDFSNYQPIIESADPISNQGGYLTIYGKRFGYTTSNFNNLQVLLNNTNTNITYASSSLIVIQLNQTLNAEFSIQVQTSSLLNSNYLNLQPVYVNLPISKVTSQCLNNCGGSGRGYCINSLCQCYADWGGDDCRAKIISIPNPIMSSTSPQIDDSFKLPYEDDDYQYIRRVINIVKLDELDINGNIVQSPISTTSKLQWNFINSTSNLDQNTIEFEQFTYTTQLNNSIHTNLTIIIQNSIQDHNITFGSYENLQLKKNSIKYLIQIDKYPFQSNLNRLSLGLSISLQSNSGSCSLNSFTQNQDYSILQLKVNDKILFGRFLNKGLIDDKESIITNLFYPDSDTQDTISSLNDDNDDDERNENILTQLNYIDIVIPNYKRHVELDPDFILLQDTDLVISSDLNSVCIPDEPEKKPFLTKAGIAGVVVGSVILLVIIAGVVAYIVIKNRQVKQQTKLLQQKLTDYN